MFQSAPCSHLLGSEARKRERGAMLVAYRLAGLSALGAHYAGLKWRAMRGGRGRASGGFPSAGSARSSDSRSPGVHGLGFFSPVWRNVSSPTRLASTLPASVQRTPGSAARGQQPPPHRGDRRPLRIQRTVNASAGPSTSWALAISGIGAPISLTGAVWPFNARNDWQSRPPTRR